MTKVIMQGPIAATCDVCGKPSGNLPKHRVACARAAGRPALATEPTQAELDLIERAGAHAAAEAVLRPSAQLQGGVTDLDVARVLLFLDGDGEIIYLPKSKQWLAPAGSPLKDGLKYTRRSLTTVVNEASRLGLVYPARNEPGPHQGPWYLAAALVHYRSAADRLTPMCASTARPSKIKRYRLVDDLTLVDCQGCVDIAST